MSKRIFLAGATGAVGKRLVLLLRQSGYAVWGTTRSPEKAAELSNAGVTPVVVDVYDLSALIDAVASSKPEIAIHQLTDLPASVATAKASDFAARNARIRREGTANLVEAALQAGVRRMIAQSIAWAYAPGFEPYGEAASLDLDAPFPRGVTVGGVQALEEAVLQSPERMTGIVLRYGRLYGPGTGAVGPDKSLALHVDAAAHAALLAIEHGSHGLYNIAEPSPVVTSAKAMDILHWSPDFRLQ